MVENVRSRVSVAVRDEYVAKTHSHSSSPSAVSAADGCDDPDGFAVLNRVRDQLDSMKSGKFRTVLGVIDAAAKVIHVYQLEIQKSD